MSTEIQSQLWEHLHRYVAIGPEATAELLQHMELRELKKSELLLEPGQDCQVQWFVVKGVLRSCYTDAQGLEHNLQFAIENWWSADLGGYFREQPAELHIQALESSTVLALTRKKQEWLFEQHPALERFFRIIVQNAYVEAQRRILATLSLTAEERFERFLRRYPGLLNRIPQYHIAGYIGVTPEFFSKMKSHYFQNK